MQTLSNNQDCHSAADHVYYAQEATVRDESECMSSKAAQTHCHTHISKNSLTEKLSCMRSSALLQLMGKCMCTTDSQMGAKLLFVRLHFSLSNNCSEHYLLFFPSIIWVEEQDGKSPYPDADTRIHAKNVQCFPFWPFLLPAGTKP